MALRSKLVNLDAMIKREDFASLDSESSSYETVSTISLRDFTQGGLLGPSLRKPDFQRETNHWSPDQVVSLLECFVNGDLIPSVILWKSPTYLFVIDGGHRLSVLRSWVEDDYGDGPVSQTFFGYQISEEQRKIAQQTRVLIAKSIGTWQHYQARVLDENLDPQERIRLNTVVSRGLQIQWVRGDADKAESSFFKINTKGTPLDEIEELLLKNRRKSISIAARAIIRAGKGHRYWSSYGEPVSAEIEGLAKTVHSLLFDPEVERPIKTLDLPLGGPKGVRAALETLIEVVLIANRNQLGEPRTITSVADDSDGAETIKALTSTRSLMRRVTGNDDGSLGLHPAVYFYGPTGRHSGSLFMGTLSLIGSKLANNDPAFFKKFTTVRARLENLLVIHKELIATILQKSPSAGRAARYAKVLDFCVARLITNEDVSEQDLVTTAGLEGKIVVGVMKNSGKSFSDDTKSSVFIKSALKAAIKCPICSGYIDSDKSISYDHINPKREGGIGSEQNLQLTHPYCNQSIKC